MKSLLLSLATSALILVPRPALADEACETEFREYLMHKHEGYPHAVSSLSIYDGRETKGRGIALAADSSISFDDVSGNWTITKGLDLHFSMDKGKTWRKLTTMPEDTYKNFAKMYEQQAATATEISCEEKVEYEGKTYRLIQGHYKAANGSTIRIHQQFYTTTPRGAVSNWTIRISKSEIAGKSNVLVETITGRGEDALMPKIDMGE